MQFGTLRGQTDCGFSNSAAHCLRGAGSHARKGLRLLLNHRGSRHVLDVPERWIHAYSHSARLSAAPATETCLIGGETKNRQTGS
jgi:hypothetical protein